MTDEHHNRHRPQKMSPAVPISSEPCEQGTVAVTLVPLQVVARAAGLPANYTARLGALASLARQVG